MAGPIAWLSLFILIAISDYGSCDANGTNAGVTLTLTNKGLDYINQVAGGIIDQEILAMKVGDMSHGFSGGRVAADRVRIRNFLSPEYEYKLMDQGVEPGLVQWSMKGGRLVADGHWNGHVKKLFRIGASGSFVATVNGIDLRLLTIVYEQESRPKLDVVNCIADLSGLSLKIRGGVIGWMVNIFKHEIATRLRPVFETALCKEVTTFAQRDINHKLNTIPLHVQLNDRFQLDYTLVRAPRILPTYVTLEHKGDVKRIGYDATTPFSAGNSNFANFPADKMLRLTISEYVVNSWLYQAHETGMGRIDISKDKLPQIAKYFEANCEENEFCLGKIINGYREKYANSNVTVTFATHEAGKLHFLNNSETVLSANGAVTLTADDTVILTLNLTGDALIDVTIQSNAQHTLVKGKMTLMTLMASSAGENALEDLNDPFFMDSVLDFVKPILEEELNKLMQKGVPAPIVHGARMVNVNTKVINGHMVLFSDIVYQ